MRKESLERYKNKLEKFKQERIIAAQDFQDWVNDGDGFHDSPMMAGKKADLDYINSEIHRLEELIHEKQFEINNKQEKKISLKSNKLSIQIGSKVKLLDIKSEVYKSITIVTSEEAGMQAGFVSADSPLGQVLINKNKGDAIELKLPNGLIKSFKVIAVS